MTDTDATKLALLRHDVDAHEKRLQAINGSIARSAAALEALADKIDDVVAGQATQAAVSEALKQQRDDFDMQAAQGRKEAISTRQFVIGLIVAVACVLLAQALQGVHF